MSEMYVLRDYHDRSLIGIFSTKEKANKAALERFKHYTDLPPQIEEASNETFYSKEIPKLNRYVMFVVEPWTIDKALVNNEWIIL